MRLMSITDIVLAAVVMLFILYAVYDEFIMNLLKGPTLLRVNLKRRNKTDCAIFVILIGILIYNNTVSLGGALTNYLLIALAVISIYCSYIRWPKLLFKQDGFFYANIFLSYRLIKQMNLTEDGILVMDLTTRRLLIQVADLDDLPKILNIFIKHDLNAEA
jgi:uncharacterized membrane protein YobD (UPF0266 family)